MQVTDTRSVVETAFLTALIMVFVFIGHSVPMLGGLATILAPSILALIAVRRGIRFSWLSMVTLSITLAFLMGPSVAIVQGGMFGMLGVGVGYAFVRRWPLWKWICIPSALSMIAFAVAMLVLILGMGGHPAAFWNELRELSVESTKQMAAWQGQTAEQTAQSLAMMDAFFSFIQKAIFGVMAAMFMFFSLLVGQVTTLLGKRFSPNFPAMPRLVTYQSPLLAAYGFCATIIAGFGLQSATPQMLGGLLVQYREVLDIVIYGLGYVCGLLVYFQGVAFTLTVMESYRMKNKLLRVIVIIISMLYWPTWAILGICDLAFNMRARWMKKAEDNAQE